MIKSLAIFFPILACALVNSRPLAWKPSAVCRCAGDSVAGRSPGPMSLAFCARAASSSYSLGRFRNGLSVGWWGIVGVTVGFLEYIVGISSIQRVFFPTDSENQVGNGTGKNGKHFEVPWESGDYGITIWLPVPWIYSWEVSLRYFDGNGNGNANGLEEVAGTWIWWVSDADLIGLDETGRELGMGI